MLKTIKENYVNICIALAYTITACLVYGIWSYYAWHLWYVSFIIVIVLIAAGSLIGFFWIKSEIQKKNAMLNESVDKV